MFAGPGHPSCMVFCRLLGGYLALSIVAVFSSINFHSDYSGMMYFTSDDICSSWVAHRIVSLNVLSFALCD